MDHWIKKIPIRIFVYFILLLQISCTTPFAYNNFLFGGGATAEDLDEIDSDLFETGPIDLPVTVAKNFDTPDLELVDVDISETDQPLRSSTEPLYQQATSNFLITVTGQPGAISDPTTTDSVIAYRLLNLVVDLGSELIVPVNPDGSFQFSMVINDLVGDTVMFASWSTPQQAASPFLFLISDLSLVQSGTGFSIFITTNTNGLDDTLNLVADEVGNYYLQLDVLLRRHFLGTELDVLTNSSVDLITALDEFSFVYVNPTGKVILSSVSAPSILSTSTGPIDSNSQPLAAELVTFEQDLVQLASYNRDTTKIIRTTNGVVVSQFGSLVKTNFINTTSLLNFNIIPEGFADAKVAVSTVDSTMYALVVEEGVYNLYSIDLAGSLALAWEDRTLLAGALPYDVVNQIAVSNNTNDADRRIVFEAETGGNRQFFTWTQSEGIVEIYNESVSSLNLFHPVISNGGTVVVACDVHTAASEGNQLFYFNPGGAFNPITANLDFNTCDDSDSFFMAVNNFLHFFRGSVDGSYPPQHAIVNLSEVL